MVETNRVFVINIINDIWSWIEADWKSNQLRFVVEVLAWCGSVGCALILAYTAPNPPLHIMYPLWIASSGMYGWASWSRRSFGMLANYALLNTIDVIGYVRMLHS